MDLLEETKIPYPKALSEGDSIPDNNMAYYLSNELMENSNKDQNML